MHCIFSSSVCSNEGHFFDPPGIERTRAGSIVIVPQAQDKNLFQLHFLGWIWMQIRKMWEGVTQKNHAAG